MHACIFAVIVSGVKIRDEEKREKERKCVYQWEEGERWKGMQIRK